MLRLDTLETLMAAALVLLLGRLILARVAILRTYTIPEPVVGGLFIALLVFGLRSIANIQVEFDTTLQAPLMLMFFATIGLNADIAGLKAGGRALIVFFGVVVGLLVMQDTLGILLAYALGQERLLGLLGASVTLSGGHGTGAAWAKVFSERHGLASATEIAIACATFGLILGGVILRNGLAIRGLYKVFHRSASVLGNIWLFWSCRWSAHSLSTSPMRSSSSCFCCCLFTAKDRTRAGAPCRSAEGCQSEATDGNGIGRRVKKPALRSAIFIKAHIGRRGNSRKFLCKNLIRLL